MLKSFLYSGCLHITMNVHQVYATWICQYLALKTSKNHLGMKLLPFHSKLSPLCSHVISNLKLTKIIIIACILIHLVLLRKSKQVCHLCLIIFFKSFHCLLHSRLVDLKTQDNVILKKVKHYHAPKLKND